MIHAITKLINGGLCKGMNATLNHMFLLGIYTELGGSKHPINGSYFWTQA